MKIDSKIEKLSVFFVITIKYVSYLTLTLLLLSTDALKAIKVGGETQTKTVYVKMIETKSLHLRSASSVDFCNALQTRQ